MNGLKYIRTRCNYSQRALAEKLGVSRQAVNMWENSKKIMSEQHREAVCELLGIDNPEFLNELTPEMYNKISGMPIFRLPTSEGNSERFSLRQLNQDGRGMCFLKPKLSPISLDDELTLKRMELKTIFESILDFTLENKTKNSYDNLHLLNMALKIFGDTFDLWKEARIKFPEFVMVYVHTIFSILEATSISFGLIEKADLLDKEPLTMIPELYDYRNFSIELAEFITQHLDTICDKIQSKRENPHENYRRRKKKINKSL